MKKALSLFLLLLFVFSGIFTACSSSYPNDGLIQEEITAQSSILQETEQYTIALVMKTLTNPFFINMEKGARQAAKDFNINLIVQTGAQETSIEQQIQIVEELISQKVDAIVIAPGSSVELVHVLKQAQDAGIAIVNIDNRLDKTECQKEGLSNVPYIGIDNEEAAYLAAKFITDQVKEPTQALILEGIQDAENAIMRKNGALKAFSENTNINVVASQTANWKIDEAYSVAAELFDQYPDIGLVFCANDMMALGVIQYLKESNRSNVLLAGFDDLEDAQTEITNGWMDATINQRADLQGYQGIQTAMQLLESNKIESDIYIPVELVTEEDLR